MEFKMLIAVLVSAVALSQAYFEYSDCDEFCQNENKSCTISMTNPDNFPCDCIDMESSCLELANRKVVCLRRNKTAEGGEDIWEAYQHHLHPTTPAPTPGPINPSGDRWLRTLIAYSAVTTFVLLMMGILALSRLFKRLLSRSYETLNEEEAPLERQDLPYQSTTQPL